MPLRYPCWVLAFGCALLSPQFVKADDCLVAASPVTGQLRIVETKHPNGTLIRAYVVFVEDGPCAKLEDVDGEVSTVNLRDVQLAPSDEKTHVLDKAIGRTVVVRGKMGLPFTAWHVGAAMMFDANLITVLKRED